MIGEEDEDDGHTEDIGRHDQLSLVPREEQIQRRLEERIKYKHNLYEDSFRDSDGDAYRGIPSNWFKQGKQYLEELREECSSYLDEDYLRPSKRS